MQKGVYLTPRFVSWMLTIPKSMGMMTQVSVDMKHARKLKYLNDYILILASVITTEIS